MENTYQKLLSGVDSFYFGIEFESFSKDRNNPYDDFLEKWQETLNWYKKQAQQGKQATIEIGEQSFEVRKSGRENYQWILQNKDFSLALSSVYSSSYPQIYVELRSNFILSVGLKRAVDFVCSFISNWVYPPARVVASRLDLFLDMTGFDFSVEDVPNFLCRARFRLKTGRAVKTQTYYRQREITGFTFGRGSKVVARIYNKIWEIKEQSPAKKWLFEFWKQNGWDGESPVWRIEFQLRRESLREFGIDSLGETLSSLGSLWRKLAGSWITLRESARESNPSRWKIKPVWEWIRDSFDFEPEREIKRVKSFGSNFRLKSGVLGNLTSYLCVENKSFSFDILEEILNQEASRLVLKNASIIKKNNNLNDGYFEKVEEIPLDEKIGILVVLKQPRWQEFKRWREFRERSLFPEHVRKDIWD